MYQSITRKRRHFQAIIMADYGFTLVLSFVGNEAKTPEDAIMKLTSAIKSDQVLNFNVYKNCAPGVPYAKLVCNMTTAQAIKKTEKSLKPRK